MAQQTSFNWENFNKSLGDERRLQERKRANRDAQDTSLVQSYVDQAKAQADARAKRQAALDAGVYDVVTGLEPQEGSAPTRPGAAPLNVNPFEMRDESGKLVDWTADISDLTPVKQAKSALKQRQDLQNIVNSTSGGWEVGGLSPTRRGPNESKSPWDALNEKLGIVEGEADTTRQDLTNQYKEFLENYKNQEIADVEGATEISVGEAYGQLKADYDELMKDAARRLVPQYNRMTEEEWAIASNNPDFEVPSSYYDRVKGLADGRFRIKHGGYDLPEGANMENNALIKRIQRNSKLQAEDNAKNRYKKQVRDLFAGVQSNTPMTSNTYPNGQPMTDTAGNWDF